MLGRLFGVSSAGTGTGKPSSSFDACCGNRTKKDVKVQKPITPNLVESPDGNEAAGTERSGEAEEDLPQLEDRDSSSKMAQPSQTLRSYEEAHEEIIKESTDIVSEASSSDTEEIRNLGKMLSSQSKKARAFFKKDGQYSTEANAMRNGFYSLKEEFMESSPEKERSKYSHSMSTNKTASISTHMTAAVSQSHHLPMGTASTASSPLARQATAVSAFGQHSDEDEDEDEDEDDPKVLDRKYRQEILKVNGKGEQIVSEAPYSLRRGIQNLREKMENQGIEEPPSESDEEVDHEKPRVLEMSFQVRTEHDLSAHNKVITFRKKRLGIRWEKRLPMTISEVLEDSHAQELGVQVGWKIIGVNSIDLRLFKRYPQAHKALMDSLRKLPEEIPKTKKKKIPKALLDHVCTVSINSAAGFKRASYQHHHICSCEIPGKPHSKVHTRSKAVDVLGEDETVTEWNEEFVLFDWALGDHLEFAVFSEDDGSRNGHAGEDGSLGRAEINYHSFSTMLDHDARRANQSKGFELTLIDPSTLHLSKIMLKVEVRLDMLPEKEHEMNTYRTLLRNKLLALGVSSKEVDASLESVNESTSVAGMVKAGLLAYHQHSEALGTIYPFPGKSYDEAVLEEEDLTKFRAFSKRLDTSDPGRLWPRPDQKATKDQKAETTESLSPLKLQEYAVTISFSKPPTGEAVDVKFDYRPIGIKFSGRAPIKISEVKDGSEAARKNVQPGWIIESVNSKPCRSENGKNLSFAQAQKILQTELARLTPLSSAKLPDISDIDSQNGYDA